MYDCLPFLAFIAKPPGFAFLLHLLKSTQAGINYALQKGLIFPAGIIIPIP